MNDPRPFFPFYPDDFWGSEAVETMTMEAAGLYVAMLSRSWRRGSIPADPAALKALFGGRCRAWDESLAMVLPCFYEEDGRLYNRRLEDERDIADGISVKASGAAKTRWNRWKAEREEKRRLATAMRPHSERIADAVPAQSERNASAMPIQDKTETGQDKQDGAGEPPPTPKKPRKEPTGPAADFMRWWCERWLSRRGTTYTPLTKDFVAVAKLLKLASVDEVMRRADRFLIDPSPWAQRSASPANLHSQWNAYGVEIVSPPRPGPSVSDYETVRAPR